MQVSVHRTLASLPATFIRLLDRLGKNSVFASRVWLENYANNGISAGDRLRIYALQEGADAVALLAGVRSRLYSSHPKARVLFFQQPDGLELSPFVEPCSTNVADAMTSIIDHVRDGPETYDVVRFGPLDPNFAMFGDVKRRLRARGFLVQSYFNYPNWHERVAGMTSEDFLSTRSRDFRRSIRRRERRLAERGDVSFEMITEPQRVDDALTAYRRVFAMRAPHLQEEPLPPAYVPGSMHAAARVGALRYGMVHVAGEPAAYQYCVVSGGVAFFIRTGYDTRFRKLGVGKHVIFGVLAHVLDEDHVDVVDFGIGDHEYKSDWVETRRERFGIAAYNPRTRLGLQNALMHMSATKAKPPLKRLRDRILRLLP